MSRIYLNTYQPLCSTATGRKVIRQFGLPPFIDGSCRREPDLEAEYPSISALCRGGLFAPKLRKDDFVVYLTKKQGYEGLPPHRRLVAILQVTGCFVSHQEAAQWYLKEANAPLPSNCIVGENPPVPWERTHRNPLLPVGVERNLENWEEKYGERAGAHPEFCACVPVFRELFDPPVLTDEVLRAVFMDYGRIPVTQNPPTISQSDYDRLRQLVTKERTVEGIV